MKQLPDNFTIYGVNKTAEVKNKAYSIEEVYEAIKNDMFAPATKQVTSKDKKREKRTFNRGKRKRVMLDGEMIKANSQRLQLFYTKGFKCVQCGTEGKFFIMVKNRSNKGKPDNYYHLELVGITPSGQYVLMTKDHIVPKAKGGKDILENYQTMCIHCNVAKADNSEEYVNGTMDELKTANKYLFNENAKLKKKISELTKKLAKYE